MMVGDNDTQVSELGTVGPSCLDYDIVSVVGTYLKCLSILKVPV